MVRLSRTLLCFVLIMLLVTDDVLQTSEARKLVKNMKRAKKCIDDGKYVTEENEVANPGEVPSVDMDAFRPTKPGHSPGVGHSIHE